MYILRMCVKLYVCSLIYLHGLMLENKDKFKPIYFLLMVYLMRPSVAQTKGSNDGMVCE
jgi:hypothetical protein